MPLLASQIDQTQFRAQDESGTKRRRFGMYTGPKSYSNFYSNAGTGDPVAAGDVGLGVIDEMDIYTAVNASGVPLAPVYVSQAQGGPVGGGIIWMQWTTNAEVANGTDLSGYSAYFEAIGR